MLIPNWPATAAEYCFSLQRYGLWTFPTESQQTRSLRCSPGFWTTFLLISHELCPLWLANRALSKGKVWEKLNKIKRKNFCKHQVCRILSCSSQYTTCSSPYHYLLKHRFSYIYSVLKICESHSPNLASPSLVTSSAVIW